MLTVNQRAPDFNTQTPEGTPFSLSSYRGKKHIALFFFQKVFSPICTREACLFRDNYKEISERNCEIVGISYDVMKKQLQFKSDLKLPFLIIQDQDRSIAKMYDVQRFGGYIPFIKRVTYFIDIQGVIRNVIHNEFVMQRHITMIKDTLRSISSI